MSLRNVLGLGLTMVVLAAGLVGTALAATLIVVRADGSASVTVEDQPPVIIPAGVVQTLNATLTDQADAAVIQDAVAEAACFAPDDERAAAAVATYALTLVPTELSEAVIAGALACNANAADEIETAAGPGASAPTVGTITPIGLSPEVQGSSPTTL